MKTFVFRNLVVAAFFASALTACVSMPQQQAFNREAHKDIHNIAVLETYPTHTSIFMLNNPAVSFGLIGGLIAAGDQASKEKRFRAIMESAGFDPLTYFKERLTERVSAKGYTLVWPASQTDSKKIDRGAFGLRKTYPGNLNVDAQLDVNFGFVGYAAGGAGKNSPYRPTVTMGVRLVSADGKQNFYTDYIAYNNIFNLPKAVALDADSQFVYPTFNDLESAGTTSVDGLKKAIDGVAEEIAKQI